MARAHIVSTRFRVRGVRTAKDVRRASQALFDIFASQGLGQAAFEITGDEAADLWIKHPADTRPDRAVIAGALAGAGPYELLD